MASINSVTPKICNPWNNKNKLITSKEIHNILRNYNINKIFKNIELFQQACVHTSYKDKSEE